MTAATESVQKQALQIAPIERAALIEHLFSSFNAPKPAVLQRSVEEAEESGLMAYSRR